MKYKLNHILLKLILVSFLGYLFYVGACKAKEGFFDKTETCSIINRDKNFILGQITDVSNNITNLQSKILIATGIANEVLGFLRQNSCFTIKTDTLCKSLLEQLPKARGADIPKLQKALSDAKCSIDCKTLWTQYETAISTEKVQRFNALLDAPRCITLSSNFICSELRGQYTLHKSVIQNAQADIQGYTSFFNSKKTPLDSINTIQSNAC